MTCARCGLTADSSDCMSVPGIAHVIASTGRPLGYRLESSFSFEPEDRDWLPLDLPRLLGRDEAIESVKELAEAGTLRPSWRVVDDLGRYFCRITRGQP